jgi:hypothetical protein
MFLVVGSFFVPFNDSPTIIIVPSWVNSKVSLPEADATFDLVSAERCADILGHESSIEFLKDGNMLNREGHPDIVRLFVDQEFLSPADVRAAVKKLRSGWDPNKKVVFLFVVGRSRFVALP